jgi:hypothetical protein
MKQQSWSFEIIKPRQLLVGITKIGLAIFGNDRHNTINPLSAPISNHSDCRQGGSPIQGFGPAFPGENFRVLKENEEKE